MAALGCLGCENFDELERQYCANTGSTTGACEKLAEDAGVDAGPPDAGGEVDAGSDAGENFDAGVDGGVDGGTDGGIDGGRPPLSFTLVQSTTADLWVVVWEAQGTSSGYWAGGSAQTLLRSPDGLNWQPVQVPAGVSTLPIINGVIPLASLNRVVVVFSEPGAALSEVFLWDQATNFWTDVGGGLPPGYVTDIIWSPFQDRFYLSHSTTIFTRQTFGSGWVQDYFDPTVTITALTKSGGSFVAAAAGSGVLTPPGWTLRGPPPGFSGSVIEVVAGLNEVVAFGPMGAVMWSNDSGNTWRLAVSNLNGTVRGAAWIGAEFVAVTNNQLCFTSRDGDVWMPSGMLPFSPNAIAGDGPRIVVVGQGGRIAVADK
ncbi:MAG: hypothetical protein ACOZIN_09005 [Myxococcota bacterium]